MSNTINLRHKRIRIIQRFKSSGAGAVNDCSRPSAGSDAADLKEFHREKIKLKKAKRGLKCRTQTALEQKVEAARKNGSLKGGLMNFSRTPKGQKRELNPRLSIWPADIFSGPGRMG